MIFLKLQSDRLVVGGQGGCTNAVDFSSRKSRKPGTLPRPSWHCLRMCSRALAITANARHDVRSPLSTARGSRPSPMGLCPEPCVMDSGNIFHRGKRSGRNGYGGLGALVGLEDSSAQSWGVRYFPLVFFLLLRIGILPWRLIRFVHRLNLFLFAFIGNFYLFSFSRFPAEGI